MTYDELQAEANARFDAARAGFRPRPGGYPGRNEHWVEVMAQSVCDGLDGFPTDTATAPVTFSTTFVANYIVGGGAIFGVGEVTSRPSFRASTNIRELARFVMVEVEGETVAMTIEEAFRRGLREVEFPKP